MHHQNIVHIYEKRHQLLPAHLEEVYSLQLPRGLHKGLEVRTCHKTLVVHLPPIRGEEVTVEGLNLRPKGLPHLRCRAHSPSPHSPHVQRGLRIVFLKPEINVFVVGKPGRVGDVLEQPQLLHPDRQPGSFQAVRSLHPLHQPAHKTMPTKAPLFFLPRETKCAGAQAVLNEPPCSHTCSHLVHQLCQEQRLRPLCLWSHQTSDT
mmetsp:Transcript_22684/g.31643  ORF Transcript_22684/g.31643 Transcript_22684/m.31643 type:complete len:205 (+) Transcript_22684:280-894(+)